jgi:hypothetical protein
LSFRDLKALPSVLDADRAALVIEKTHPGNLATLLVSARPPKEGRSTVGPASLQLSEIIAGCVTMTDSTKRQQE